MKKFLKAFDFAFRGIVEGFKEQSMKFHGFATLTILLMSWYYRLSINEWIIILILIGLVWSTELINSSIEELSNVVRDTNQLNYEATKKIRDMAAGAVLIMAIIATIAGLIIFIPKILNN